MKHIFFWVAFLAAAAGLAWNVRRLIGYLRLAKPDNRFGNVGTRIRNVLVVAIGQSKLLREPVAGAIHAMIFWGFLVLLAAVIESVVEGLIPGGNLFWLGPVYSVLSLSQDIFCVLILIGVLWALYRRYISVPPRLRVDSAERRDAALILVLIGVIVGALLVSNAARLPAGEESEWAVRPVGALLRGLFDDPATARMVFEITWWIHIVAILGFMNYLPYSKHLHVLTSIPNVYFARIDESGAKLDKIDFEAEGVEKFGVSDIEDFTWKQLLDGMTCTHCGRCTSVCPAAITGKVLDPRQVIIQINHRTLDKAPLMVGENGTLIQRASDEVEREQAEQAGAAVLEKKLAGDYIPVEALWQCTTCMACVQECPVMIEHVPAIVDMRRALVMMEANFPAEVQPAYQSMENNFNPWGFPHDERAAWAADLPYVKVMEDTTEQERAELDVLFWVGCAGSYDDRYKKVTRSFAELMNIAGVKFAILGTEERCNGDHARRTGNEYLAQMLIQMNVETMNGYGVKKIVTSCPHCFNIMLNEYPYFGGRYEVVHHTTFISDLVKQGRIRTEAAAAQGSVTYHDSCYLGRYNDVYDEPRELIGSTAGHAVVEMERSKSRGLCCGAGGGQMFMEETEGKRINIERTEEALATGADTIATACPFCMTMLNDGVKSKDQDDNVRVQDVAEIVLQAVKA
ncbi:MAG TPA: heterodisulfide reductase-related iron-sulfur binding cluster [Candidatus Kapabacteria bacterium]|nr:heterodisulfide reductase-related iron-sulfur binding cluster [Candidatus Kapabacteria bacterium]